MSKHHHQRTPDELDSFTAPQWNGLPQTLQVSQSITLPQTTTGSLLVAWYNTSKMSNAGELTFSSGGSVPQSFPAPALAFQPSLLMNNWNGNNLTLGNTSYPGSTTPIWVAAFAPGLPGAPTPASLPADGTPVVLTTLATAQGMASSTYMRLRLLNNSGTLAIVAIIGGPPGPGSGNGYIIALNAQQETGPSPLPPPPPGYFATTTANSYDFQFHWGASTVFVAAMSPNTTLNVTVSLRSL